MFTMKNYLVTLVAAICIVCGCVEPPADVASLTDLEAQIDIPKTEVWEVVAVEPAVVIKHGIDLKGPFDSAATPVSLSGPEFLSQAVSAEGLSKPDPIAYLNWYRITKADPEDHGELILTDQLAGSQSYKVQVGSPAFLLSPSQRITNGPPDAIPVGLNYFKAYEIKGADPLNLDIELTDTFGSGKDLSSKRRAIQAAFVCLPTEEWHHEEFFPIENPNSCFVVYGLDPASVVTDATTIDQFGIHKLQSSSSSWLCVTAKITH